MNPEIHRLNVLYTVRSHYDCVDGNDTKYLNTLVHKKDVGKKSAGSYGCSMKKVKAGKKKVEKLSLKETNKRYKVKFKNGKTLNFAEAQKIYIAKTKLAMKSK